MPQGRSTFTKRQKEQARRQKQREKAERRSQRNQEKATGSVEHIDINELRGNADAQAALFQLGSEQPTFLDPAFLPRKPTGA